uniref:Uncharacterized protein n=1 Tax=Rhizophora mucronata TaxID=61149 RepID=A0A2P2NER3_RHIMU
MSLSLSLSFCLSVSLTCTQTLSLLPSLLYFYSSCGLVFIDPVVHSFKF